MTGMLYRFLVWNDVRHHTACKQYSIANVRVLPDSSAQGENPSGTLYLQRMTLQQDLQRGDDALL